MLLHNNTLSNAAFLATQESPTTTTTSTSSVYPQVNSQPTPTTFFQDLTSSPWIQQQFFVRRFSSRRFFRL